MSIVLRTPYHVTLLQVGSPPSTEPGVVKLYASNVGGTVELFIRDSGGNDSQITNEGVVVAGALLDATGAVDVSAAVAPTTGQVLTATSSTTATWQDPTGSATAEALGTTGADVTVGTAAPPTVGQTLTATSATTATWQTVSVPISTGVSGLGAGVATFLATPTSANLRGALTDETGTGSAVFSTSPTLVTPALGTPSSATLTNATGLPVATGLSGLGTGVATFLATPSSSNLAAAVTDETGSGAVVFATSPTLVTPALGTPSSATLTNATGLPISTGVSGLGTGVATFLATPSSANLAAALTDETGTGANVFATSPTLVTPALGTPSALVLTNATGTPSSIGLANGTGLPISTGVSGLGSGVATFLATPSSANLAAALTDETGTGANVFATSPTLVTPVLGTPTSATLTNATGLPISTGVSGLGTGVATFLATPTSANLAAALTDETGTGANVFATSPTLVTPVLGTPSSATLTNATGLPISTGVSGLGTGVATFLATPTSANLAAALTDETGTGANVFATSPTLVTPALGTPSALVLTNATGRASSSQTADQIATSGTAVTISATAPSSGQVLTATSASAANWQTPAGVASASNELWVKPGSPNAADDEFESTTLDASWVWRTDAGVSISGSVTQAALSPFTSPATFPRYQLHTQRRSSWLQWQAPADATFYKLSKTITPTTDMSFFTRISVPTTNPAKRVAVALFLAADSAGVPDPNNVITVFVDNPTPTANQRYLRAFKTVAGVGTELTEGGTSTSIPVGNIGLEYLGIRKSGTSYGFFAADGSSYVRIRASEDTISFTLAHAGFRFINATGENTIFGADFFRVYNSVLGGFPW